MYWFAEARRRNLILYNTTLVLLALAGLSLVLMAFDNTQILGINRWIKPLKFDISVAIYLFTTAWISKYLPSNWIRKISIQIVICLGIEMVFIYLQAARGVKSHFNTDSVDGGIIYAIMGIFILYNTVLIALILRKFFTLSFSIPKPYLTGIRLGLISLLMGSLLAIYMSSSPSHTVGAPDGGPGLPFLNWSTKFGDLRVMHFIALHGYQLFILFGAYLSRSVSLSTSSKLLIINTVFMLFAVVVFATFVQAALAHPFIAL